MTRRQKRTKELQRRIALNIKKSMELFRRNQKYMRELERLKNGR